MNPMLAVTAVVMRDAKVTLTSDEPQRLAGPRPRWRQRRVVCSNDSDRLKKGRTLWWKRTATWLVCGPG